MTTPPVDLVPLSGAVSSIEYFIDCPTGTVEQYFSDGVLRWSDELYRIHGYERGDVVPTVELGLSHVDPVDRDAVDTFWSQTSEADGPRSVYTSIRDAKGQVRKLLISADLILDDGKPVGTWALVVDLTRSIHADSHRLANEAVAASAAGRAVIEQAKGILMGRAGFTANEAFNAISRHSQNYNRKVVVVAQEIIDRAGTLTRAEQPPHDRALLDLLGNL